VATLMIPDGENRKSREAETSADATPSTLAQGIHSSNGDLDSAFGALASNFDLTHADDAAAGLGVSGSRRPTKSMSRLS